MRVVPVPCLKDNYAYLVIDDSGVAAVVDPGEAAPVLAAAHAHGVRLTTVWATHHHGDHVGGIAGLRAALGDLAVVAHPLDAQRIAGVTKLVDDDATVELGELRARIIHNPGHTLGAISFVVDDAVFTGDTMFAAGCGRLFEGSAAQLRTSLARLAALPPTTRVFFGHEYTAANLVFAAQAWPDQPAIAGRAHAVAARRAAGQASTPSTIADERVTNPFVAIGEPAVQAAVAAQAGRVAIDLDQAFADLRAWKDGFRG